MKKYLTVFLITLVALTLLMIPGAAAEAVNVSPIGLGIDLTPIFQALIALLASVITIKVIPWIKARTTSQQQEMLRAAVSVAVYAAEQLYGAGKGHEKLMYVKGQLARKGFHVDVDEIEAAVQDLSLNQERISFPQKPQNILTQLSDNEG
jgi:lipopolysaccharide export LptBFGC system permease protein LptF